MEIKPIAEIYTDMPEKFGIPRQSGLVGELVGKIVFKPEYRIREALNGIEEFSHLWLIWQFSENVRDGFSPTVRPPRLNGNTRRGVFATRSSFRPNALALSCVELERVDYECKDAPVIYVRGVDMKNKTPLFDIKPYIAYTDCHPEATEGFAARVKDYRLEVCFPESLKEKIPPQKLDGLIGILEQDPRPSYQNDNERIYGVSFAGFNVKFKVDKNILFVTEISKI